MDVFVHVCVCICVCAYVCVHICVYMHVCMHVTAFCLDTIAGVWKQADATDCDTSCGVAAGSGTNGTVTCSKPSGCKESGKPAEKQCEATPACGRYSQDKLAYPPLVFLIWKNLINILGCMRCTIPQALGNRPMQPIATLHVESPWALALTAQ